MALNMTEYDNSEAEEEPGAIEEPPAHMSTTEVFARLLGQRSVKKKQLKRSLFPGYSPSGTNRLWENKAGCDVAIIHPAGVTFIAHKAVISSSSAPLYDYFYNNNAENFTYATDGRLQFDFSSSEPFTMDAFLQYEYSGRYRLPKAVALSRAHSVSGTVPRELGDASVSALLLCHLQIHHLGEQFGHPLADEAFGHIRMIMFEKRVDLDDFRTFAHELFQNSNYDTPLSGRIREVVATYAAYFDPIWIRDEKYCQLFRGDYQALGSLWISARWDLAQLEMNSASGWFTATQLLNMASSTGSDNPSTQRQHATPAQVQSHSYGINDSSTAVANSNFDPSSQPAQADNNLNFSSQLTQTSTFSVQPSTSVPTRSTSIHMPHLQSMQDTQMDTSGPPVPPFQQSSNSAPPVHVFGASNAGQPVNVFGSNMTAGFNISTAAFAPPQGLPKRVATGTKGIRRS